MFLLKMKIKLSLFKLFITLSYFITFVFASSSECRLVCPKKNKIYPSVISKPPGIFLEYKTGVIKVPVQQPLPYLIPEYGNLVAMPGEQLDQQIIPQVSMRLPSEFSVDPVAGNQVDCKSKKFLQDLKELRKKIRCSPRPVIVDVISSEGVVVPDKVQTKQCSGLCTGGKTCQSVATANSSLSVRIVLKDGSTKCANILIPQDTKCRCKCPQTKKSCNSLQSFDKKLCKCKCNNEVENRHCLRKATITKKHKWDNDSCSCACKEKTPCTTGTAWDRTHCRCVKISKN